MTKLCSAFLLFPLFFPAATHGQAKAVSPDGKRTAVAVAESIQVFDNATKDKIWTTKGPKGKLTALVYSPDGKLLVVGSKDKSIWIFSAADGKALAQVSGEAGIVELSFSEDGKTITSRDEKQKKVKWDAETGKKLE